MIDTRILLNDFEFVANNLAKRGINKDILHNLKQKVDTHKKLKAQTERQRSKQNKLSKDFHLVNKSGNPQSIESFKKELQYLKESIKENKEILDSQVIDIEQMLLKIPNLIDENTPIGKDESCNIEIKKVLAPSKLDFIPKQHWELAKQNKWIDTEAGVKLAKSRFSVLRGMGAKLNQAIISYMLDFNAKNGFEICSVPIVVNERALIGTGQLPKFADDMFKLESFYDDEIDTEANQAKPKNSKNTSKGHNLYLISTSEIALTNLYQDTIIPKESLPIMLTSYTPCFRKEAGSARKDTRGIIRQHQFDKVELVAITTQQESKAIQQKMIENASKLLESLELPHRLVQLCSGDIGFSATNTVDIEVWLPGQNCYREISSISNCGDFQARRAKIRYKDRNNNILAHTLNGSSLAVGRTLVAIMENFQQSNGDINIPKVLEKYL
ncbi:serine--tRNA ligase [Helicobacter muridarum]|uniref:Serine--tRNA ligase n=1 Tax=Helicobacter muridarum TaxID=216 RepID=A0A099TZZ8_9HELI|nr:serine--tRNA ligase [Helicobacter muridarum]TLD99556.1 serine--tRNA ligase [Helicobacter muridarum]STQ85893.1 seryl-tRNA synthetase [Helicobacter muridarum]